MAENIDVLLVNPGNPRRIFQGLADEFVSIEPPVFCGLFATYLRKKGLSVAIFDPILEGLDPEQAAKELVDRYDPILIALIVYGAQPSGSTQNMTAAEDLAKFINELTFAKILMTGTHPASLPERTMQDNTAVDFVCSREGPVTIYKVVQALKVGAEEFYKIPSLWWRYEDGTPRVFAPKAEEELLSDLDQEMPGIAWDLLPSLDKYRSHNWHSFDHIDQRSPYAAIHTSLGCPYKCSFCCINAPFGRPAYRMWSPATVVNELIDLSEKGVTNIKFVDEMFVLNPSHVMEICNAIKIAGITPNIWAYARVDTVQDRFLELLKSAGVNWLCLGIESASQYVRDGADKKYGNEDIINTVRRIQSHGIYVIGNFIFGLPDDTIGGMRETLRLAMELNCEYANFYSAMAYPGSALYKMAVNAKRELPTRWEDYSQHGYGTLPLANDFCSAAEILEFRDIAFLKYFMNLDYLSMVERKFDTKVVEHIRRMTDIPLNRKILED